MLDLNNNSITYTASEQSVIDAVLSSKITGSQRWNDSRMKSIKNSINRCCLKEQQCYCAFCEGLVNEGDAPIEHISPKGLTPDFVFEPQNLVVSCTRCNSPKIKGEKATIIGAVNPVYANNSFCIVHPRLDNPNQHILFQDTDRTVFDEPNCSQKGQDTISFFQWNNLNAYRARVAAAATKRLSFDQKKLLNEISTYK